MMWARRGSRFEFDFIKVCNNVLTCTLKFGPCRAKTLHCNGVPLIFRAVAHKAAGVVAFVFFDGGDFEIGSVSQGDEGVIGKGLLEQTPRLHKMDFQQEATE